MACIEIKHLASGEMLVIPEGQAYSAEWRFTGRVDLSCNNHLFQHDEVEQRLEAAGIKWGDAIAWTTKKLGIKQCAPCKARQQILNHAAELGWAETIRQLKETF